MASHNLSAGGESCPSNIKDHCSQVTITNNKKFEILLGLPKCDTNSKWANALGKMAFIDLLDTGLSQMFNL